MVARLRVRVAESLPLLPFFAMVGVFLVIPTVTVVASAFVADGRFSLALHASRYERNVPTLREGCPDFVRLVEQTIGPEVVERFEPT